MIELFNITKSYEHQGQRTPVLQDVSLKIPIQESLGIMGKSGSGKSTLVRVLLRLIQADSGRIYFKGQDLTHMKRKDLKPYRKSVQLIAQSPQSFFDPAMRMRQSMQEALKNFDYALDLNRDRVLDLLADLKLDPALLNRYPHQLSGGEVQRFALARALSIEPDYLVLDEATSMLDISVQAQILNFLKDIRQIRGLGYLVISHDRHVIDFMCDRVHSLEHGKII